METVEAGGADHTMPVCAGEDWIFFPGAQGSEKGIDDGDTARFPGRKRAPRKEDWECSRWGVGSTARRPSQSPEGRAGSLELGLCGKGEGWKDGRTFGGR